MFTIFLVVDADDLGPLTRALRDAGYRVIGVSDAESAEYILSSLRPDLVITEFPGLAVGGARIVDFTAASRRTGESKAVALLHNHERGIAASMAGERFDAAYVRPIVATTLVSLVRRLLEGQQPRPLEPA